MYCYAGVLELVYRMVSKTIALSGLRVQVPSPVNDLKTPLAVAKGVFVIWIGRYDGSGSVFWQIGLLPPGIARCKHT